MVDHSAAATLAKRLINANGRSCTMRRRNTAAANASRPWDGPAATISGGAGGATITATICFVPASGGGLGKELAQLAGFLVTVGMETALVASLDVAGADLGDFDQVVDGSRVWEIRKAHELRPGSVSMLWVLELA